MAISDIQAKFNIANHIYRITTDIDLGNGTVSASCTTSVVISSVTYYRADSTISLTTGQSIYLESGVVLISSDGTTILATAGDVYSTISTAFYIGSTASGSVSYVVGNTLTIPTGCTLDFQGGSFSNGTINGNGTNITSNYSIGFLTHIVLSGTLLKSGATTARPTLLATDVSFQYFDTTLNKPIWWTGTTWVDSTGATV